MLPGYLRKDGFRRAGWLVKTARYLSEHRFYPCTTGRLSASNARWDRNNGVWELQPGIRGQAWCAWDVFTASPGPTKTSLRGGSSSCNLLPLIAVLPATFGYEGKGVGTGRGLADERALLVAFSVWRRATRRPRFTGRRLSAPRFKRFLYFTALLGMRNRDAAGCCGRPPASPSSRLTR